jgi:hypothetical protein
VSRIFPRELIAVLLVMGLAGCAAAPAATSAPPNATAGGQALAPLAVSTETALANGSAPTEPLSPTPGPFVLDLTPVPTETALPTLELPTQVLRPPPLQAWDGLPTYPAESRPDYYFRVQFDPNSWALTTDAYGFPALAHRDIANCIIAPTQGRGLPPDATVDHEMRRIGNISYQISTTSLNGARQAVTYAAGDGRIYTAFQVSVEDRADQCLSEAEMVLGTLTSVPLSEATPISTP